jgi:NagD protein
MNDLARKKGYLCDMDGVLYNGMAMVPGVPEFISWMKDEGKAYLFLTNESRYTPAYLREKLSRMGIETDESHFYTSSMATADFLSSQSPGCSVFVIGEEGTYKALEDAGISIDDSDPDYVIVTTGGEYNLDILTKAVRLVKKGARLIGTAYDPYNLTEEGIEPDCRALCAPIEVAADVKAYFVGKPNPLMIRKGLERLGLVSSEVVMIGDTMETDIVSGIEAGIDTALVLSGVTTREQAEHYPYKPRFIINSVKDIADIAHLSPRDQQ